MGPQLLTTIEFQRKETNGYISILTEDGWIKEHIYTVSKFLNMELKNGEVIHHINFCRKDNRLCNLMLFKSQKEHQIFHNKLNQFRYFTNPMKREIFNNIIQVKLREQNEI